MQKMRGYSLKGKKIKEYLGRSLDCFIIILYIVLLVFWGSRIMVSLGTWKYPGCSWQALLYQIVFLFLLPICFLFLSFYQKKKYFIWRQIFMRIGIMFYLCLIGGVILLCGSSLTMSYTTELENYYDFDEGVEEHINNIGINILPKQIPQNVEDVKYVYKVGNMVDTMCTINVSWKYTDCESYEYGKSMVMSRTMKDTYEKNGYIINQIYINPKYNGGNLAIFGYDDSTRTVFYQIEGVW